MAFAEPNAAGLRITCVIGARIRPSDLLLFGGTVAAAALCFPRWGLAAALVVAVATLSVGVGRRMSAVASVAAASTAAAGFVHFAVAPEHFAEWWGFGTFFVLCGEVQLGWALVARRVPRDWVLRSGSPAICPWCCSGSSLGHQGCRSARTRVCPKQSAHLMRLPLRWSSSVRHRALLPSRRATRGPCRARSGCAFSRSPRSQ